MKYVISILIVFSISSVRADSFDTDWAKFSSDFEALNYRSSPTIRKVLKKPPSQLAAIKPDVQKGDDEQLEIDTPVESSLRDSDKLGYQISDPQIRQKVVDLYRRPDVVVKQYVIPFN